MQRSRLSHQNFGNNKKRITKSSRRFGDCFCRVRLVGAQCTVAQREDELGHSNINLMVALGITRHFDSGFHSPNQGLRPGTGHTFR